MPTISVRVAASTDDVTLSYWLSAWYYDASSTECRVGVRDTGAFIKVGTGMRFILPSSVPKKSNIVSAKIDFTSYYQDNGDDCNTRFTGQINDAATFADKADYQARRGTVVGGANNNYITTAQVDWDALAHMDYLTVYTSPELKTIFQEMVNYGTLITPVVFWDDHDGRSTAGGEAYRQMIGYDRDPTKAPLLTINYKLPGNIMPKLMASGLL